MSRTQLSALENVDSWATDSWAQWSNCTHSKNVQLGLGQLGPRAHLVLDPKYVTAHFFAFLAAYISEIRQMVEMGPTENLLSRPEQQGT